MKVFKYQIEIDDYVEVEMPIGSRILDVQTQHECPCIWALVDPGLPTEKRRFRFAGTGHPIKENPSQLIHIGTFQMMQGRLIFHLFEIKEVI